jgi:hypothetical protein
VNRCGTKPAGTKENESGGGGEKEKDSEKLLFFVFKFQVERNLIVIHARCNNPNFIFHDRPS